jgi:UDP-2-acetamido-2-deoxy-ribo-hexuluronate aminotransferase
MTMQIPFIDLKAQFAAIEPRVRARMDAVLAHGQYIMGPEVAELEAALAAFVGDGRECITCASGTEGLLMALMALGIGPGDEVITSPFTFAATGEVIALVGATPIWVDVRLSDANIDESKIAAAITSRTRAIMPVSLYGQTSSMATINEIAAAHGNIAVIEDAAQSFGAVYQDGRSCGVSTIGVTSFFPSKPLGCYGDGGAIFTADPELAKALREIRVHGQSQRYVHTRIGVGGRMDTLQCAIVLAKLERFEQELAARARIGARYIAELGDLAPQAQLISVAQDRNSVWGQFTLRVADRPAFAAALGEAGVPTAIHYPVPLNQQVAYRHFGDPDSTPNAAQLAGEVVSLPMSADLSDDQQAHVIATVRRFFGK